MIIGQAAIVSGVSQRMIRHYEKIGLIPAALRRDSGYRDYADTDVHRLRFIANARDLGFPIEDIRSLLALWDDRDRSSAEVKALAIARSDDIGRKAEALQALRRTLLDLAERCHGGERPECPIIDQLQEGKPKDDQRSRGMLKRRAVGHADRRGPAATGNPHEIVTNLQVKK
ncbi:MerR family transcriptional regulator [Sphingobium sp. Ant17]|nr:MerR family transcriptional regulator [Sphingobium sp. Ant17]